MTFSKDKFYQLIELIKQQDKRLRIKIYNGIMTPGGASGEYGANLLEIAIGGGKGPRHWHSMIGLLAHEYTHHLREQRLDRDYIKKVGRANLILYGSKFSKEQRLSAAKVVMSEEYFTDSEAFEVVMKDWDIQEYYSSAWWYYTNLYNYKIKFFAETGIFYYDMGDYIKAPNRKLLPWEIYKPLSPKKKREIISMLDTPKLRVTIRDYTKICN